MGETEVFEPRSAGRAIAIVAFPVLSVVCVLLGVVAVLKLSPITGMILFIGCLLLSVLPIMVMAVALRGSFTLNIDDEGMVLIGVLGGRVRLPWTEQAAVGLAAYRGATWLAVRPLDVLPKRAPRRSMVWDRQTRLLMVSGLDNYSAPRDEVVDAVRRFAGPLWNPAFDTVHPY